MSFELVTEIVGHQGDVRSLTALGASTEDTVLITGARDRVVKLWKSRPDGKLFDPVKEIFVHEHWVGALLALPDGSGFVTACQDTVIRRFDTDGNFIGSGM
mmetsp:Transcript_16416/g.20299  ORF Transcript_16416/g.20299 Transcript_16416/m.20299 type:complete len:101 (-) Transcript_16416:223-525(-)